MGVPDPVTQRAAPLHWIAADKSGKCIVIEQTGNGIEVLDNPIGVLANSPDFHWHMTNLKLYGCINCAREASEKGKRTLIPFWERGRD